ncbi:hypothetical protein C8R44DRAFT_741372 [Mycena epipterygia]|nr:hypothetical protein C8R44DRAFT_741372 [Mycena epipterygia]
MPHQPTITALRLENIIACLKPAVTVLGEIHDSFGTPFVQAIVNTTLSLITVVQSKPDGNMAPDTLQHIGKFTETLQKIHVFGEAQQEGNKIKSFFRQGEMKTLLKDCQMGLQQAVEVFKIDTGLKTFDNITEMERKMEGMLKDLLELISTLSDGTITDSSTSGHLSEKQIYQMVNNSSRNSSNSLSMLPSKPKIFHGRDTELINIVKILSQDSGRIAILGGGGMGKTSLARAVLHHPDIGLRYEYCFFVACDSAATGIEIAALIGPQIGLKPGKDLRKSVVQHFGRTSSCLLVLDNLETAWEPRESHGGVEEFLSLLTDLSHLALMITMRGAERPAKVRWTCPFLAPLKPLTDDAARHTFMDITENFYNSEQISQILSLTDNMPLAVDLIAHLVDYEGCSSVLTRWETEKTVMLSEGNDKQSSLDASITMSLSSPRLKSFPGTDDLLSILSILPDGLSETELVQINIPTHNVLGCKAALLGTSLAYTDDKKRLKSLVPIREHIQHYSPPSPVLIQPLFRYFHALLDVYQRFQGTHQIAGGIKQLKSNLGNLNQVLGRGLYADNPELSDVIKCTIWLGGFYRNNGHGPLILMNHIPAVLPQPCDHRLEALFITEVFKSKTQELFSNPDLLIAKARTHFEILNDPLIESDFYAAVGDEYSLRTLNTPAALHYFEKALGLSKTCGAINEQCSALNNLAAIKWRTSDYSAARMHAVEAGTLAEFSGNFFEQARALQSEAVCCISFNHYKNGLFLCHRARKLLGLCGMSGGRLDYGIMTAEAEVYLLKSEYAEARSINIEIVHTTSAEQEPVHYAVSLLNIAEIDIIIGTGEHDVHQNLDEVQAIFSTLGWTIGKTACECALASLNLREGNIITARNLFHQCLSSSWVTSTEVVAYCLERLADVEWWGSPEFDWSSTWTVVYLAYAQRSGKRLPLYKALGFLGDVLLFKGDQDTAHNLFVVALKGFSYMDIHQSRAQCMFRLGELAQHKRDLIKAAECWREARSLFQRSLQAKSVAQIDVRLAALEGKDEGALEHIIGGSIPWGQEKIEEAAYSVLNYEGNPVSPTVV